MAIVIAALIIFGIAVVSIVLHTFKKPSLIWIITSVIFVVTWVIAIGWALSEFVY